MIIKLGGDKEIKLDAWELSKIISVISTVAMVIAEASKNKSKRDS